MIPQKGESLHMERMFPVSQEKVFSAWASATSLNKWFGLDPSVQTESELDFRVGGSYMIKSGEHVVRGTYKEISPHEKIVFTWKWDADQDVPDMLVSLEFAENQAGTRMTIIHDEIAGMERLEQHKYGWEIAMVKFAEVLEQE